MLSGFGQAMQQGDLDGAVSYILPERRAACRDLFPASPESMPSFGELLGRAEMSFLSQHGETTPCIALPSMSWR